MQSRSTHILFFHGLESGPGAYKHRFLKNIYGEKNVHCIDMDMSLFDIMKPNSISRQLFVNAFTTLPWNLLPKSIQSSLNNCLTLQLPQLQKFQSSINHLSTKNKNETMSIHKGIVVASSFGGAVATIALARGVWNGPTILLAPAYGKLSSYGVYEQHHIAKEIYSQIGKNLTFEQKKLCCIFHGTEDRTIDIIDSIELSELSGIRLVKIDGGNHSLNEHLHVINEEIQRIDSIIKINEI